MKRGKTRIVFRTFDCPERVTRLLIVLRLLFPRVVWSARCINFRQAEQLLELAGDAADEAQAREVSTAVASGAVPGVPATATVEVDGVVVAAPPPSPDAGTYLHASSEVGVSCFADDAACAASLLAAGFNAGARVITCTCASSRAQGVQHVYVSNSSAADAGALANATAKALGVCVKVAVAASDAVAARSCPAESPSAISPVGGAGGGSKKGLLGLLGLILVAVPVVVCVAVGLFLCWRRRRVRKLQSPLFAPHLSIFHTTQAPLPPPPLPPNLLIAYPRGFLPLVVPATLQSTCDMSEMSSP